MPKSLIAVTMLAFASLAACGAGSAPAFDPPSVQTTTQRAVLAGGCFWGCGASTSSKGTHTGDPLKPEKKR